MNRNVSSFLGSFVETRSRLLIFPNMEDRGYELPQLLSIELMRLGGRLISSVQGHLKRWEVSTPQFNVLRILYVRDEGDGVSCQTVIDRLLTPVPDLTRLLTRLEERGWVTRYRDPRDRRIRRSKLTDSGRRLVEEIYPTLTVFHQTEFSSLSPTELETLFELVEKAGRSVSQLRTN